MVYALSDRIFESGQLIGEGIRVPNNVALVAIQNYGCSGSLFLQSLLDGHPNILMLPTLYGCNFYYFYEKTCQMGILDKVETFIAMHYYWFHPEGANKDHGLHQMGENMDEPIWIEESLFREALSNLIFNCRTGNDRKDLFLFIHIAYAYALGREIPDSAIIVFPSHSLPIHHIKYLVEDFPDTLFIHTLREPLQNIASTIKHILYNKLPVNPFEAALSQIVCDYMKHWGIGYEVRGYKPYFDEVAERTRAVRLEDLHKDKERVLRSICKWIGIPWDDSLNYSTFNGKKWWNRPESLRISGADTKIIAPDRYKDTFNLFDRIRLSILLYRRYENWHYKVPLAKWAPVLWFFVPFMFLLPFRQECRLLCRWDHMRRRIDSMAEKLSNTINRIFRRIDSMAEKLSNTINRIFDRSIKSYFNTVKNRRWSIKKSFSLIKLHLIITLLIFRESLKTQEKKADEEHVSLWCSRFLNILLKSSILIYLVLSDYIMIRWWVFKGWLEEWRENERVRLLSVE